MNPQAANKDVRELIGQRRSMRRRLIGVFGLMLLLFIVAGGLFLYIDRTLETARGWTEHTFEVLVAAGELSLHIPMHIVSAADDVGRGRAEGAVGYLPKPVERSDLEAAFARVLEFAGGRRRRLLVVDDDMRNTFALSRVLRGHGLKVLMAADGYKALDQLQARPDVDIVLMDIMMPGLDGYETMRRVRAQPRFANLPMLALTAKAMSGDREKCLEAGANDYLAKPIDTDKLLSLMRAWT